MNQSIYKLGITLTLSVITISGCSPEAIKALNTALVEAAKTQQKEPVQEQTDLKPELQIQHQPLKPRCDQGVLEVRFGQLKPKPKAHKVTKWKGDISVHNGHVTLLETLKFEDNDRMLPTPNPARIAWETTTGPHFDGVRAKVIAPPRGSGTMVVIDTGYGVRRYPLKRLGHLYETFPIDQAGNRVEILGTRYVPDGPCSHQ